MDKPNPPAPAPASAPAAVDDDDNWEFNKEEAARKLQQCSTAGENHPFFLTTEPGKTGQISKDDQAALDALQSLVYDDTPIEILRHFKKLGNEWIGKTSKDNFHLKNAIQYYTQALEQKDKVDEKDEVSMVYSNRAHVQLLMENFGYCASDARDALKYDPKNVKAHFRLAKAALGLKKLPEALDSVRQGLEIEPNNKALRELEDQVKKEITKAQAVEDRKKRELEKKNSADALVNSAIELRRIKEKKTEISSAFIGNYEGIGKVRLDEKSGILIYPLLIIYDKHGQSDFIHSVDEMDTLYEHLQAVFSSPPPWDTHGEYRLDTVRVLYRDDHDRFRDVPSLPKLMACELVARPDFVLPGRTIVLHVWPRGYTHSDD